MKQGMTRKLAPKDKHSKASWKKRDDARKGKQEQHQLSLLPILTLEDIEQSQGDPDAEARVSENG